MSSHHFSVSCLAALAVVLGEACLAEEPAVSMTTPTPVVRVCVDKDGVLAGEPQIATSSGNARIDAAALQVARQGRYQAARKQTGIQCLKFRVKFELRDE